MFVPSFRRACVVVCAIPAVLTVAWAHTIVSGTVAANSASVADTRVTVMLGPVEISTFNPVTITGLEVSTNLYFELKNTGSTAATLGLPNPRLLPQPSFSVLPIYGFQANEIVLAPGETRVAEFLIGSQGTGTATIDFNFVLAQPGQAALTTTVALEVRSLRTPAWRDLSRTATVTGIVTAGGSPLANADVTVWPYNHGEIFRSRTDSSGRYTVTVPSMADITAALGPRPLPYPTLTYFVVVDHAGYSLGYADGVAPSPGETVVQNLSVSRLADVPTFNLVKEIVTDGPHGYWWVQPNAAFTRFAAVQGRHPPELHVPGHVLMLDDLGNILWRRETADECWGMDYRLDRLAVGCHDGTVAVYDADGNAQWSRQLGHINREVRFGPDARRLLTGPASPVPGTTHALVLYDDQGQPLWTSTLPPDPVRSIQFAADGTRIWAGLSGGALSLLDAGGAELWRRFIGEFPLAMTVDPARNVYAFGKNEEIFSFSESGQLRWRYRIPNVTLTGFTNAGTSVDQIVVGTTSTFFHAIDSTGRVRWQRQAPSSIPGRPKQGHNALYVSRNGQWIVAGMGHEQNRLNSVALFDRHGSLLWSHEVEDRRDPATYVPASQLGAISVAVSEDGGTIVAGYSDSVIRVFKRPPAIAATPVTLRYAGTRAGTSGTLTAVTGPQTLTVDFRFGTAAWTATSGASWLQIVNGSGSGAGQFSARIVADASALNGQTSLATTITLTSSSGTTATIPITLNITQQTGTTASPIGQVDTPAQNATDIVGAIGVTGWALDDVGVASVKIYRPCLLFDNQASCQAILGQNVVFVGDAAFLPGARPDVEGAFPAYPVANAAGWGMQILTNMLPHIPNAQLYGGQGALTLFVYATDLEGNVRLLGRSGDPASPDYATPTFITMGNDTIVKPFGTIDTPLLGGTISGVVANFGWVLTPDSNTTGGEVGDILMTTSGAGMVVYIDGIATATVAYNQCRGTVGNPPPAGVFCNDDIANIFGTASPQASLTARTSNPTRFRNLDATRSAIGAYVRNTTTMTNGRHQIAWGVADSAARGEGIGSRFFTVLNSGADRRTEAQLREAPAEILGSSVALDSHTPGIEGVYGRTGYALDHAWKRMFAGDTGTYTVRLPESGRLELWLGEPADAGYLVANGTLRPLPVGSTLAGSYFAWMPPVGYVGPYTLAFVRGDERIDVTVTVAPVASTPAGEPEIRMHLDQVLSAECSVLSAGVLSAGVLSAGVLSAGCAVRIEGWSFDPKAAIGSGIGAVHIWAKRVNAPGVLGSWGPGVQGGASPIFLGAATLDIARPDVSFAHPGASGHSGYQLTAALGAGTWELTAYVWNDRTARWEDARTATVTIR